MNKDPAFRPSFPFRKRRRRCALGRTSVRKRVDARHVFGLAPWTRLYHCAIRDDIGKYAMNYFHWPWIEIPIIPMFLSTSF